MGEQAEDGAVDPRPEEMETGSQTGMAPVAISDDAAGKSLADIGGSATTQAPKPTTTTDARKAAAQNKAEVTDVVLDYGGDDGDTKNAIIDVSTGIKSVVNTTAMVDKASSQSVDMKTGAQVAHSNAVGVLVKRFEKLCEKIGQEAAEKVKSELAKLHGAEEIVENLLKTSGVTK